jgi:hypothetical protein
LLRPATWYPTWHWLSPANRLSSASMRGPKCSWTLRLENALGQVIVQPPSPLQESVSGSIHMR